MRHHILFGSGDVEDASEIAADRNVECFYVLYQTPIGLPEWVGGGFALTLADAVALAETILKGGVQWQPE